MSTHPVEYQCRILYVGASAEYPDVEEALLPDPRLRLENTTSGGETLAEMRARTQAELPNLIFCRGQSLNMPLSDFVCEIKGDERLAPIPIIVLTSPLTNEEIYQLYVCGATCVITVTTEPNELKSALSAFKVFWLTVATLPYCSDPVGRKSQYRPRLLQQ